MTPQRGRGVEIAENTDGLMVRQPERGLEEAKADDFRRSEVRHIRPEQLGGESAAES